MYESVPGSAVENFRRPEKQLSLLFQRTEMYSLRLSLSRESEYEVFIGGESAGRMNTNLSGKLSVSVELAADQNVHVKVVKC